MSSPHIISPHFTLAELTRSQAASRLGIRNVPNRQQVANLKRLCALVLEPLRADLGAALHINSAFRNFEVNLAVGSSRGSQHTQGLAADIVCHGVSPLDLCHRIDELHLPFDQLIYEGTWTHVSVSAEGVPARGQLLTAHFQPGRRTTYTKGLPYRPGDRP